MILIGLGANLDSPAGGPGATIAAALSLLEADGIRVVARSRDWQSPAWPPSDQPPFVNVVARLESELAPEALLARLHAVEARFGRVRSVRWAARPLDIDLLDHDGAVFAGGEGGLELPHPRMADRAFVILPLAEVAPDWRHPVTGRAIGDLVTALPADHKAVPIEASGGPA